MKTLHIFRHGETDWNKKEVIQGWSDIPLNENGIMQAKKLADNLAGTGIQIIYSSDLKRAQQTAEIAGDLLKVDVICTPALREVNFGKAEGTPIADALQKYSEIFTQMNNPENPQRYEVSLPSGETKKQAFARFSAQIEKICADTEYTDIGIFTHGAMMGILTSMYSDKKFKLDNCSYLTSKYDAASKTFYDISQK